MKTLDLEKYGPIISSQENGDEIFAEITKLLEFNEKIEVDLKPIKTMATFCAKQVFGQLYLNLTPSGFYERIKLLNVNEDLKMIIRLGILSALQND
jgi:hypothetical protein